MKKLLILVILCLPLAIFTQHLEVGIMAGGSIYNGDLNSHKLFKNVKLFRPAGGLFGQLYFNEKTALRLSFNMGKLVGDDQLSENESRGLKFHSFIFEVGMTGSYQLFKIDFANSPPRSMAPYVLGGVAVFHFNPKADLNGTTIELAPLGTEGQGIPGYPEPYGLTQFSIPLGLGIKMDLNDKWALGFEFGGRKLFTDYLDDVSNTVIDYQTLRRTNGDLATQLSIPSMGLSDKQFSYKRGGDAKDWYYFTGILLSYKFGEGLYTANGNGKSQLGCPKI